MKLTFNDIIRKLTSRKLWVALAGVVTGIAMIFGAEGGEITDIAGAVTTIASAAAYIIAEAFVDAANKLPETTEKGADE